MPKIDIASCRCAIAPPIRTGSSRSWRAARRLALGNAAGLTQFGVNLTRIKPGAASALRHWHENEDEFVYMLEGELVLVEDEGETILKPGDCAGFKANVANGHHLVNRIEPRRALSRGRYARPRERAHYPDVDLP